MKKFHTFTCYSMQAQKQNILYKVTEKKTCFLHLNNTTDLLPKIFGVK